MKKAHDRQAREGAAGVLPRRDTRKGTDSKQGTSSLCRREGSPQSLHLSREKPWTPRGSPSPLLIISPIHLLRSVMSAPWGQSVYDAHYSFTSL